ncbi:hypothetical protein GWK47_019335 [Chionoecetes opilio]|uniref:Uncharacterized protein n=1 Tax=Chionoecetes opilio TaxID=41210 RepID=A0A8J5CLB5_CHIOP|nr:hypothetical protein GWK47_019335 [Chionoecetes opilio]
MRSSGCNSCGLITSGVACQVGEVSWVEVPVRDADCSCWCNPVVEKAAFREGKAWFWGPARSLKALLVACAAGKALVVACAAGKGLLGGLTPTGAGQDPTVGGQETRSLRLDMEPTEKRRRRSERGRPPSKRGRPLTPG